MTVLKMLPADDDDTVLSEFRAFDIQDHKNMEAVTNAELDVLVFRLKRYIVCQSIKPKHIDELVAAVTKATIATARRMKREEGR
jgi:hypothetical protein